jgi:hypothetical protein
MNKLYSIEYWDESRCDYGEYTCVNVKRALEKIHDKFGLDGKDLNCYDNIDLPLGEFMRGMEMVCYGNGPREITTYKIRVSEIWQWI